MDNLNVYDCDSKKIFQLRKEEKLVEAYNLAVKCYGRDQSDEWLNKAYAWVLIDIIKNEIQINSLDKSIDFFQQLDSIKFFAIDDILQKQINFLRPKININYQQVLQANSNSKNGNHTEALSKFRQLNNDNKLSPDDYESYGWSIYRCLKNEDGKLEILDLKKLLNEYLKLNNPKPSMVHSFILQKAMSLAKQHNEFNIYEFFKVWNPAYLRDEDKEEQYNEKDKKTYPSLLARILKEFVNKNYQIDIVFLQNNIKEGGLLMGTDENLVIDAIREAYFWKIFNLHKENKFSDLWRAFNFYAANFSNYETSNWHSEILKIANRFMIENESWRFFDFFQKWGVENFSNKDWKEQVNGDFTNKPLVLQSLHKIFELSKLPNNNKDFQWILLLYEKALKKFDGDKWLLREHAILLNICGKGEEAIVQYKSIVLELADQSYVWHEFAKLLIDADIEVAISMLCKSITMQKNEDFLGEIRLGLASAFIKKDKLKEAKRELDIYRKHRKEKKWKLSEEFELLDSKLVDVKASENDFSFYKNSTALAEDYIYSDIDWIDFLLYEKWKTKEKKEKIAFTNLNDIEFVISANKFTYLKNAKIDDVYQFKVYFEKSNNRYTVLNAQKSDKNKEHLIDYAKSCVVIVDHINLDKKLFHYAGKNNIDGIIKLSQTEIIPKIGNFLKLKYFTKHNNKLNRDEIKVLKVCETKEKEPSLIKDISGDVCLKYKFNGATLDYEDAIDENEININKPDFAFIDDIYIPKFLLKKQKITTNIKATVKALYSDNKWKVFSIEQSQ